MNINGMRDLFIESKNNFIKAKECIHDLGPYHEYSLNTFEILPSNAIDNKNNRVIFDSFADLACDKFWEPIIHGRSPFGMEIFADGKEIVYHLLLPPENISFMINKIYGVFNGSSIRKIDFPGYLNFNTSVSDVFYIDIKKHPFMPFKTDLIPIGNYVSETLETLKEDEKACVQMLFQPLENDWQSKCLYAYREYQNGNRNIPFGTNPIRYIVYVIDSIINLIGHIFGGQQTTNNSRFIDNDFNKMVREKINSVGYRSSVRISVESSNKNKRSEISRSIVSSFNELNKYNEFIFKKYINTKKGIYNIQNRKMSLIDNFFISSKEAGNLISLPDIKARITKLKKANPKEEIISKSVSEGKIYIGDTLPYKNTTMKVNMASKSFNEINKTLIVIAPPGFGKSTLDERLAYETMNAGFGFLQADTADGSMAIRTLKMLEDKFNDKIAWLDFTDLNNPPLFSVSMLSNSYETKANLFVEWFEQMLNLTNNAPRSRAYLKKYALSCFVDPNNGFHEFKLLLDGDINTINSVKQYLQKHNPALYLWWEKEYANNKNTIDKILEPIKYRLDELLEDRILRSVFGSNHSNINIRKWMDEGYAVIMNLPESEEINETHQRAIMSFMFLAFWSATLSRRNILNSGKKPRSFKLLLDEPDNYLHATNTIKKAINKFRKYGVSINVFMHSCTQIIEKSKELWDAFMMSQPNLILGAISDKDLKMFRSKFDMSDEEYTELFSKVQNRDSHNFVINMSFDSGLVKPFVFHAANVINDLHDKKFVIQKSKKEYCHMSLQELEDEYFAKEYNVPLQEYKNIVKGGATVWENKEKEEVNEIPSGI